MDRFILREVQKGEATCHSGWNEDLLSLMCVCDWCCIVGFMGKISDVICSGAQLLLKRWSELLPPHYKS